jgi:hypothetical protein
MDIERPSNHPAGGLSSRLLVRFSPQQLDAVRTLAGRSGSSLGAMVRALVKRALETETPLTDDPGLVALAALVASEQGLRLLETLLPGGAERSEALRSQAAEDAERRLTELSQEAGR